MAMEAARFKQSAAATKEGITLLVPRPVIEAEQNELITMINDVRVQQLIIHLRRGGLKHLDVDERMKKSDLKGHTPLHAAVMNGTSSVVSALLELAGASPDVTCAKTNRTPLHMAAEKGDVGMVKALLQWGATVDVLDYKRHTPLLIACASAKRGSFHHMVAAELVRKGANLRQRNVNGDTPLHLACDTPLALPLVQEICAAARVRPGLVEALEALNVAGEGALHRAVSRREMECAKTFLKHGARSDARSADGDTALHVACREGLESIVKLLLESPKHAINAANLNGETPLHLSLQKADASHAKIARMLLARGAFAFGRTRSGESVLHACAREGSLELAKVLLQRQTSETIDALNARTNTGGTPLHLAVASKHSKMVALLLAQDGIDRGACDGEGMTAVHIAAARGDVVLLRDLCQAGRGVGARELSVRNGLGWAALHTSAFKGQEVAARILLKWGAPADEKTADGWTALHLAAAEGHRGVASALLQGGASLDLLHSTGESALGLAAARGHHAMITLLLGGGAQPTRADASGWTPMHAAMSRGDPWVAKELHASGGNVRSSTGETPAAGDALDMSTSASLRKMMIEADERRRIEEDEAGMRDGRWDADDFDSSPRHGMGDGAWPRGVGWGGEMGEDMGKEWGGVKEPSAELLLSASFYIGRGAAAGRIGSARPGVMHSYQLSEGR